jgi:hypothetical protein
MIYKNVCIFEHCSYIYLCDYGNMLCWMFFTSSDQIVPEDLEQITCLNLKRTKENDWSFRHNGSIGEYARDLDDEWVRKLEYYYGLYLMDVVTKK